MPADNATDNVTEVEVNPMQAANEATKAMEQGNRVTQPADGVTHTEPVASTKKTRATKKGSGVTQEAPKDDQAPEVERAPEATPEATQEAEKATRGKKGGKGTKGSTQPRRENTPKLGPKVGTEAPKATTEAPKAGKGTKATTTTLAVKVELTPDQAAKLAELEAVVDNGLDTAMQVAVALYQIREEKLYKATHATYEEYVEERHQMSVRRARHLTAGVGAMLVLESAGVKGLPTNEAQLRFLAAVPDNLKPKVWAQAQKIAKDEGKVNSKGEPNPTREHVKRAVEKVTGKGPGSVPTTQGTQATSQATTTSDGTTEPSEVTRARETGAVPSGVTVDVTFTEEGVDPEIGPKMDIEQDNNLWLQQFPIREHLAPHCLTLFDAESLAYRWLSSARATFIRTVTRPIFAEAEGLAKRVGPYVSAVRRALSLKDPSQWVLCSSCKGTGHVPTIGNCKDCKSAGYRI